MKYFLKALASSIICLTFNSCDKNEHTVIRDVTADVFVNGRGVYGNAQVLEADLTSGYIKYRKYNSKDVEISNGIFELTIHNK